MDDAATSLAVSYDRARPRLVRVAYAILGSVAEAEDVVSDCWLRLVAADARDPVTDVEAWATTAVARAALDVLRSARVRRERYIGPWLPEPVVEPGSSLDPAERVSLDDQVSYALLVVMESLTPAERTSWVLHDLFGVSFDDVAHAVGRSPAAVRQLAARARRHIESPAPRLTVAPSDHTTTVARFLRAAAGGDLSGLIEALDPDVVLTSDGGGRVTAARRPVVGADRVARYLRGIAGRFGGAYTPTLLVVNGDPGLGVVDRHGLRAVMAFTVSDDDSVSRIDIVLAPDKLPRGSLEDRLD